MLTLTYIYTIFQKLHTRTVTVYSTFIFILMVFIIFSIQIVILFFQYLSIIVSIF